MAEQIYRDSEGRVCVNMEEGLARVAGNTKLFIRLLKKFQADTDLSNLFALVEAGDYEAAQTEAHTIKGVAANLSLTELYSQVQNYEAQIKAKSMEAGAGEALKTSFDKTMRILSLVVSQYG